LVENPISGKALIEASAGTGKTFTISRVFLRLLLEREIPVQNILVVSFTEAATNELKDRILNFLLHARAVLAGQPTEDVLLQRFAATSRAHSQHIQLLSQAIRDFDEAAIYTIHKFCNRVLMEQAFETGGLFDTELITEQNTLLLQITEDFWRKRLYGESKLFLQYVLKEFNSPEKLMSLLKAHIGRAFLHILPEAEAPDCSAAEQQFEHATQAVKETWRRDRNEIISLLKNHTGWNKTVAKKRERLVAAMEVYASSAQPQFALFDGFTHFTADGLTKKTNRGYTPPQHTFFDLCQQLEDEVRQLETLYGQKRMALQRELLQDGRKELAALKKKLNLYYFDDLLLNLHAALHKGNHDLAENLRARYQAALIDEFQDTDPVQYEIFKKIFDHPDTSLFLIGDPKQAIYGFRGADIFAYMKAKTQTPPEARFTLTKNYRSHAELINAFNAIFAHKDNPFLFEEIPYLPAEAAETGQPELVVADDSRAPFRLWFLDATRENAAGQTPTSEEVKTTIENAVAAEIVRLLNLSQQGKAHRDGKPLAARDIACLVRNNHQARDMQATLKRHGVNSVLYTTENVFASPEAAELAHILAAVAEPHSTRRVKTALATEIIGVSGERLQDIPECEAELEAFFERFANYHHLWRKYGFIRMFRTLISDQQILPNLMVYPDGERKVTNLLHLAEVLNGAVTNRKLGMSGLLNWLSEQIRLGGDSTEDYQLRLESDDQAVTIMTIHRSKGLEFPVVFCPFSWKTTRNVPKELAFHDASHDLRYTLDLGSETFDASRRQYKKEALAGELRLFYVALTRAQNRCYFVWGKLSSSEESAPAYAWHRPAELDPCDPAEALKAHLKKCTPERLREEVGIMAAKANGAIDVTAVPEASGQRYREPTRETESLACRTFSTKIARAVGISSYSSLISTQPHSAELADYDPLPLHAPTGVTGHEQRDRPPFASFLDFPKGAHTGTFIHEILQVIDYATFPAERDRARLQKKLLEYRFDAAWTPAVEKMLQHTLRASLPDSRKPFALAEIPGERRLTELEFYFPLKSFSTKEISRAFSAAPEAAKYEHFVDRLNRLSLAHLRGFMKGFIDLVFEHDGRYYILDWKSNYLGGDRSHYTQEAMMKAMVENLYILQYHIYAVALNNYLKLRKTDYDYEKHFGGVYYIFLRGVDSQQADDWGIFAERPSRQVLAALSNALLDSGESA